MATTWPMRGGIFRTGVFVMVNHVPRDMVEGMLPPGSTVAIPPDSNGEKKYTHPVLFFFADQKDVRLLNPQDVPLDAAFESRTATEIASSLYALGNALTGGLLKNTILDDLANNHRYWIDYQEIGTIIPDLLFRDPQNPNDPPQSVSVMGRIFNTDPRAARADRVRLGFDMISPKGLRISQLDKNGWQWEGRDDQGSIFSMKPSAKPPSFLGPETIGGSPFPLRALQAPFVSWNGQEWVWIQMLTNNAPESLSLGNVDITIGPSALHHDSIPRGAFEELNAVMVKGLGWAMLGPAKKLKDLRWNEAYLRHGVDQRGNPRRPQVKRFKDHQKIPLTESKESPALSPKNGKKIVVLGGSGAIGAGVVEHFAKQGWTPIAVGRRPSENLDPAVRAMFQGYSIDYRSLDLSSRDNERDLLRLFQEADVVVNAAEAYALSESSIQSGETDVKRLYDLLEQVGGYKDGETKRFVRIGSPVELQDGFKFIKDHDAEQLPYFRSKRALRTLADEAKISVTSIVPPQVLSPYSAHDGADLMLFALRDDGSRPKELPDVAIDTVPVSKVAQAIDRSLQADNRRATYALNGLPIGSAELVQRVLIEMGYTSGPDAVPVDLISPPAFQKKFRRALVNLRQQWINKGHTFDRLEELAFLSPSLAAAIGPRLNTSTSQQVPGLLETSERDISFEVARIATTMKLRLKPQDNSIGNNRGGPANRRNRTSRRGAIGSCSESAGS